jgi:hypothetical protein
MDRFRSEGAVKQHHQETARTTVGHAMVSRVSRISVQWNSERHWQTFRLLVQPTGRRMTVPKVDRTVAAFITECTSEVEGDLALFDSCGPS